MTQYQSPYQYQCSEGHWIEGPAPVANCTAVVHQVPCPGTLTRVGPGSRKAKSDA